MPDEPNYYKEAFMEPANLAFLLVALLVSVFIAPALAGGFASNVALMFAAAAELLYLGTLPRSDRYKRVVRSRRQAEQTKPPSDRDVVRSLTREDQKRYVRFRNYEKAIRDNFARLSYSTQGLLDAHLQKLDKLLDHYLQLLQLKDRYAEYQARTGENEIVRAIEGLRVELATDPPRVASVKQRRLSILEKRLDRYKKAGENLEVIENQVRTIEDVTLYLYEQSLTMQNPEEVSFQLDTLVSEVEETQASVEAIEDVFRDPTGGLTDLDLNEFDAGRAPDGTISGTRVDPGLLDPAPPDTGDGAARTRDRERG